MLAYYLLAINVIINYFPVIFMGYILYAKKLKVSIFRMLIFVISLLAINIFVIELLYFRTTLTNDLSIMIFIGFSFALFFIFSGAVKDVLPAKVFVFLLISCYAYIIRFFAGYFQVGLLHTTDEINRLLILNLLSISLISITMPFFSHVIIKYIFTTFATASKSLFRFMWIIPAFMLIILSFMEMYVPIGILYSWQYFVLLFCFLCIMLITYIIFFNMLKLSNNNEALAENLEKNNRLIEMQTQRYKMLTDNISEARVARHDIKHHLKIMSGMLEKGKITELNDYLNKYRDTIPQSDEQISVNFAIDCLLRYYFAMATRDEIRVNSTINLPEKLFISDADLCIIIGNLVENAIEAAQNVSNAEKYITIKIDYIAEQLIITVDNPFDGKLKIQNGNYFSAKRNFSEFGIGIRSVKAVTEKYYGFINISATNNIFSVSILINSNAKALDDTLFT